jgi:hypothetical protein
MTYSVIMVKDASTDCVGAGFETFNTLDQARAFAQGVLSDFNGEDDQLFITEDEPSQLTIETFT